MQAKDSAYPQTLRALAGRATPLAYVDLDRFDRNAAALAARAGGLPIRVASKSVRCVELLKRVLARPGYRGVLAFRGREAIHLARAGIMDLVVAYPEVDPVIVAEVAAECANGHRIVSMLDRPEHVAIWAEAARSAKTRIPVALDLDLSTRFPGLHFGVRRSWISDLARLDRMLDAIEAAPGLALVGVMGYEAQIAGVADAGAAVRLLKRLAVARVAAKRAEFVARIRARGHELAFVNGGGTGSFESTRRDASVTELAAGSGLYSPSLFDGYDDFRHEPAAGFALTVTRLPDPGFATCHGGGYVASGSAGAEKLPLPVWPEGLSLLPHEGAGEVQTPVSGPGAGSLQIGDRVIFRHAKAGELCERFDELHLVSADRWTGVAPTYRGEGLNFG